MFKHMLIVIAAFVVITVLLLFSLQIPVIVEDRAELANVRLGYPIHFVVQDNSRLSIGGPDSPPFPYPVKSMNPYSSETRVLLAPLLINYLSLYVLFSLVIRYLRHRNSSEERALS